MTVLQVVPDSHQPSFHGLPRGVIRDVASFIYHAAPYPNDTIATVSAIALLAGICGRSYNINGSGLNQYLITVAMTGTGKEAGPNGIARLMVHLEAAAPKIAEVRGPGEIVSAPGLHRALASRDNPSMLCIIGEVGLMLAQLSSLKRDANKAGIERMLLHLYSKSGYGDVLDDAAYSDRQNNPGIVHSPALTISGDTTPETLYGSLDRQAIMSGLLPRFTIFETDSRRPYQNKNRILEPCPHLLDKLKRICVEALCLQDRRKPCNVMLTDEASTKFDEFERWTTDRVNDAANEITRHLWTRANLKALKLAALNAVSVDPIAPSITLEECMWATGLIVRQTEALITKFETGEVGDIVGNEILQQEKVLSVMKECIEKPFDEVKSQYGGTVEMHKIGLVTHQYLQRRLLSLPIFKNEGPGKVTPALKRTIESLAENGRIELLPAMSAKSTFGHGLKSYGFAQYNPNNHVENSKRSFFGEDPATIVKANMK